MVSTFIKNYLAVSIHIPQTLPFENSVILDRSKISAVIGGAWVPFENSVILCRLKTKISRMHRYVFEVCHLY